MADPLSLLRSYTIAQKGIEERGDHIVFGEFSWPKGVQTNFRIYGYDILLFMSFETKIKC
jgi:hypothetical protein